MVGITGRHGVFSGLLSLGILLVLAVVVLPRLVDPNSQPSHSPRKAAVSEHMSPSPVGLAPTKTLVLPAPPVATKPSSSIPPRAIASLRAVPTVLAPPKPALAPTPKASTRPGLKPSSDTVQAPLEPKPVRAVLRPTTEPPKPQAAAPVRAVLQPSSPRPAIATRTPTLTPQPETPVERNASKSPRGMIPERPSASSAMARPTSVPRKTTAATEPAQAITTGDSKRADRVLLRQLEHGKGPGIEIAWPTDPGQRARLYALLSKCHGMRAALMGRDGALYVDEGAPGGAWPVDLDRMSGFVRQVSGIMTRGEQAAVDRIAAHHGGQVTGAVVRLFPRRVDAGMLGGFRALGGPGQAASRSLTARYAIEGGRVVIGDVRIDGRPATGRFTLPWAGGGCR